MNQSDFMKSHQGCVAVVHMNYFNFPCYTEKTVVSVKYVAFLAASGLSGHL